MISVECAGCHKFVHCTMEIVSEADAKGFGMESILCDECEAGAASGMRNIEDN